MAREQINVRANLMTREQINELKAADLSQSEAVMLGIDRIYRDWIGGQAGIKTSEPPHSENFSIERKGPQKIELIRADGQSMTLESWADFAELAHLLNYILTGQE